MGASSPQDSSEEKENIFYRLWVHSKKSVRAEVCGPEPLKALKYKLLKNISRLEK